MKGTKIQRKHLECGAIAVTCVLLIATLASLCGKISAENPASAAEPYPDLYGSAVFAYDQPVGKKVYLTFDDGPSANTLKLLEVLREEEVPATFFVSAQQDTERDVPAILRQIVEEGHVIGLHTYCHDYECVYESMEGYLEDLNQINEYIVEHTGVRPEVMRFPGGSKSSHVEDGLMQEIVDEVTRRGYVYYDWNVVSGDDTSYVQEVGDLMDRVLQQSEGLDTVIVLFHDGPAPTTTPEAVRQLIPILREQGYAFDVLTPTVEPVQLRKPTAGDVPRD